MYCYLVFYDLALNLEWRKQNKIVMKHLLLLLFGLLALSFEAFATGEPSTYFNIFVPPNNDAVQRNACLIVTAIYDSTQVTIQDDGADGDTDDNWSGYLMAGQSYILYIKDNGINDDALYASGGLLKRDGDYFIINASGLVLASQATNSDWQHDWVPSVNKSSLGTKFIIYSPLITSSNRDLNVFAYSDTTTVTIRKISNSANGNISTTTNVDYYSQNIVIQRTIHRGQDLIHFYQDCRNLMLPGHTYVVESNKPVTVQYGALWGNARDGGGYVPSSNGSSAGDLFYFAVPHDAAQEQEIRIVSWDDANQVILERYSAGNWIQMNTWTLNDRQPADWVGKQYAATYATTFRVRCTAGKKVSVFEANWLETGAVGTSDIATMVSSSNGTSSGNEFLVYMAPPGKEINVVNPATGQFYGGNFTHIYLFAKDTAQVSVVDAKTGGATINRSYTIPAGRYVDCFLSEAQWKSIYNGTGTAAGGPDRPYLLVTSDVGVSVMSTNFNDNWMMYFGSSMEQAFKQTSTSSTNVAKPGDVIKVESQIDISGGTVEDPTIEVEVSSGGIPVNAVFHNNTDQDSIVGRITIDEDKSTITFDSVPDLEANKDYTIETEIEIQVNNNNGSAIPNNAVINVDNVLTGNINGEYQQSVTTTGIQNQSALTTNLIFSRVLNAAVTTPLTDTWTANWIDIDGDDDDDLYVPSYKSNVKGTLYRNDNATFVKLNSDPLSNTSTGVIAAGFGDVDNDGDPDCVLPANTGGFITSLNGSSSGNYVLSPNQLPAPDFGYQHGAAFADYDNDGHLDVFVSLFMPTEFNQLYHNLGDGTFELVSDAPMSMDKGRCIGATWADYDNDGDQDLFVPNGNGGSSYFYVNLGGGEFEKDTVSLPTTDINAVGSSWGDFDNDRDLDLLVSNASNGENKLFRNNGDGTFTPVVNDPVVTEKGNSHGCSFADVDNDGDLDIYVTNDNDLFMNDGTGHFSIKSNEVVCARNANAYGHSWSDIDRDGDLDLFVATHGNNQDLLFTNNGVGNNYLEIKLVGTQSNRSAIGARIEVKTADGWQIREVNSQSGFGGNSSFVQHFGCGNAAIADSIIVKWPSGYRQYVTNATTNRILTITEDNGVVVKVQAYLDGNGNCQKDANENGIKGGRFTITGGMSVVTNADGSFCLRLPNGNYTVTQQGTSDYMTVANCGGVVNGAKTIAVSGIPSDTLLVNFASVPSSYGYDLQVTGGHTALRRGFVNDLQVNYGNKGTMSPGENVVVRVVFPMGVTPVSAVPVWTRNNGSVYEWDVPALLPGETGMILVSDSTALSLPLDSEVEFTLSVKPDASDLNLQDNSFVLKELVRGAVDPNDMLVSPRGMGTENVVSADEIMTYTIRFQNVGNYSCHTVKIENELSPMFDLSTLRFLGTSHDAQIQVVGNQVVWVFNGIELPDSTTNEQASHGFVSYSIQMIPGIVHEEIFNNADIYFDYEQAVRTNTCRTTAVGNNESDIRLFPNPVGNSPVYVLTDEVVSDASIVDASGQLIQTEWSFVNGGIQLETKEIDAGVYYLNLTTAAGVRRVKFVKL